MSNCQYLWTNSRVIWDRIADISWTINERFLSSSLGIFHSHCGRDFLSQTDVLIYPSNCLEGRFSFNSLDSRAHYFARVCYCSLLCTKLRQFLSYYMCKWQGLLAVEMTYWLNLTGTWRFVDTTYGLLQ